MHPPSKTPCTGELEEFRSRLEGYSVEELLALDDDNDTVLHVAICQEKVALSVAISERLWKEKKSLDILNKLHQTPLYLSVICNLHILTEILINYGASLNIGSNPPLHAAAMKGNNEAIEAIIKGISNRGYTEEDVSELLNITNYHGKTALMQAIEAHSDDIDCRKTVKLLLMNNDSSMFPDSKSGKTALHYAVELRKIDLIHILLENCDDAGKLVNSRMYNGNTALHLIVGRTLPEDEILYIVGTLMNRGANVSIDNMDKEKPHDLVRREHTKVKQRLHGQANRIR